MGVIAPVANGAFPRAGQVRRAAVYVARPAVTTLGLVACVACRRWYEPSACGRRSSITRRRAVGRDVIVPSGNREGLKSTGVAQPVRSSVLSKTRLATLRTAARVNRLR